MINQLSNTINQYSTSTRSTVGSLIRDMKVNKSELNSLVSRVADTRVDQNFSAASIPMFSTLSKEIMIDSFRNLSLRLQSFFRAANTTGLALNSMVDVFSSEIEKIENDLSKLEIFIDNYQFISGEDDLFNSNYIEKFDSYLNDYRFDNLILSIPDRDGKAFDYNASSFIDGKAGVLKIGNTQKSVNIIRNIKDINIKTNYNNYITTSTDFENLFNDNFSDSWTVTIKSPTILNSYVTESLNLLQYDYSSINGAMTQIVMELERPVAIDTIRINPNSSNNLQLLQVVVYSDDAVQSVYSTPASSDAGDYFLALSAPVLINGVYDVKFQKQNVKKIIYIFNQSNYVRLNKTPIQSEQNARVLDSFYKLAINDRKNNFSKYQDIVYWFFEKNNFINKIAKNNHIDNDYYTYRFPSEYESYVYNLSEQIKEFNTLAIEDRSIYTNTPVFSNLLNNMLDSFSGKLNMFGKERYIERLNFSNNENSLGQTGFIQYQASNQNSSQLNQYQENGIVHTQNNLKSNLATNESEDLYEYSFSLSSIELMETISTSTTKAAYVSKKIPVNGQILAVKAKLNEGDQLALAGSINRDLQVPASYELSVSNKAVPNRETDWISVAPYGKDYVDSEVLFVNPLNRRGQIRFNAASNSIVLYKNGNLVERGSANYSYNEIDKTITLSEQTYSPNEVYVVSYKIDFANYKPDEIDFIKNNIYLESIKTYTSKNGPGELFAQTDSSSYVKLSYTPYINKKAVDESVYNSIGGTSFIGNFSGYSPVKVQLSDGSYAINITNYTNNPYDVSFYSTDQVLFIHVGDGLVFNRNLNSPFRVFYQYTPNDLRFRLIVRKNFSDINIPASVDSVILKMKTLDYDPYYDKINSFNK